MGTSWEVVYSLLNAMAGTSPETSFESAVLHMWKSFSGAVHDYHCAISGAHNTSTQTAHVTTPDIQKAKGPILETLLRHVLHLRALSVRGKSSRFAEVELFPTLVDTRTSESEALLDPPAKTFTIDKLVGLLRADGVVVAGDRTYRTQGTADTAPSSSSPTYHGITLNKSRCQTRRRVIPIRMGE